MSVFIAVGEFARRQHGLVTRPQLRHAGVTDRRLRTLLGHGVLVRLPGNVYVLTGSPGSWEQKLLATVLAGGTGAVASHRSAAALWQLHRFRPGHLDVSVPRWTRGAAGVGVVHECLVLPQRDLTVRRGVPVTSATRTLIDMGRYVGPTLLGSMMDDAVRRDLTTYEALHTRLGELAARGRAGIVAARTALETRPGGAVVPDSDLEQQVRTLLVRAGLPEPTMHHRVPCDEVEYVLDFAWPDDLVALECDGFRFHRTPEQLDWDDDRRNRLGLRGWVVLHATWNRVRSDPGRLVHDVGVALERSRGC